MLTEKCKTHLHFFLNLQILKQKYIWKKQIIKENVQIQKENDFFLNTHTLTNSKNKTNASPET